MVAMMPMVTSFFVRHVLLLESKLMTVVKQRETMDQAIKSMGGCRHALLTIPIGDIPQCLLRI